MRNGDLLWRLTEEHRRTRELFDLLERQPAGHPRKRHLLDENLRLLARHAAAEETLLYPAVRQYVPDGERLSRERLAEHASVKRMLRELEDRPADDPGFDALVARAVRAVAAHTAAEEDEVFPQLAAACPPERLHELGRRAEAADSVL